MTSAETATQTIFIAAALGFQARTLLRTSFFDALKASGHRLVLLVPNPDEAYMHEFAAENVELAQLDTETCERYFGASQTQRWLRYLRMYTAPKGTDSGTLDGRLDLFEKNYLSKRPAMAHLFPFAVRLMRRSALLRRLVRDLECALFAPDLHAALYERYKPSLLLVSSTGGNWKGDTFLVREARKRKVPVVCLVHSWDNPSSYGVEGARADRYLAWADQMKQELNAYQEIPLSQIQVTGAPIFDVYHGIDRESARRRLISELGLDPERKLIVYGTISPPDWHPYDLRVVEFLLEQIQRDTLKQPAQLLVRFHPRHYPKRAADTEAYGKLQAKYGNLFLDMPQVLSDRLPLDMPTRDLHHIAEIVTAADVIVNVWSTLNLEAALCDVPVINLAFDPTPQENSQKTALIEQRPDQMMRRPHIKRLIASRGVGVAVSWEDLLDQLNASLENPALDHTGRRALARLELGEYDAKAGIKSAAAVFAISGGSAL